MLRWLRRFLVAPARFLLQQTPFLRVWMVSDCFLRFFVRIVSSLFSLGFSPLRLSSLLFLSLSIFVPLFDEQYSQGSYCLRRFLSAAPQLW